MTAVKACLNADTREGQFNDNYSNGSASEFKKVLGWNDHQVAGLISSLEQKGIGYMDNEDAADRRTVYGSGANTNAIFWLSDDGINAYFDQLETEALA
jgi:hypothetical protein